MKTDWRRTKWGSARKLVRAERAYLKARGWTFRVHEISGAVLWTAPVNYPKPHRDIDQSHAVNSQRFWDRNPHLRVFRNLG